MVDPFRLYWWPIEKTMYKFIDGVESQQNTVYAREDIYSINWDKDNDTFDELKEKYKKDKNSTFYSIKNVAEYDGIIRLAETSMDIEEIRKKAKETGIIFD